MVDLLDHILSTEDYINNVAQLDNVSDANNLLDFSLTVLENFFPFSDRHSSRAQKDPRRFMLEVFSKMHNVPSLNIPYNPDNYALPLLLYIFTHSDLNLKVRHSTGPVANVPCLRTIEPIVSTSQRFRNSNHRPRVPRDSIARTLHQSGDSDR